MDKHFVYEVLRTYSVLCKKHGIYLLGIYAEMSYKLTDINYCILIITPDSDRRHDRLLVGGFV